jgi:hypothetical protein
LHGGTAFANYELHLATSRRFASLLILGLFVISLTGCGGGEDNPPGATPGATATLRWDPVNYHVPVSYTVHFGKQSSGEAGSCNYENSLDVTEPFATITDLEPDTLYHFAVSAYGGGLRGLCSNEVSGEVTRAKDHKEKDHKEKDHKEKDH